MGDRNRNDISLGGGVRRGNGVGNRAGKVLRNPRSGVDAYSGVGDVRGKACYRRTVGDRNVNGLGRLVNKARGRYGAGDGKAGNRLGGGTVLHAFVEFLEREVVAVAARQGQKEEG